MNSSKYLLRFFLLILLFFNALGNVFPQIQYTNPSPDIIVMAPEWPSSSDSYWLDVNDDGINDFKFYSSVAWAEYAASVTPLNGAGFGLIDNLTDTLNLYDSIHADLEWGNDAQNIYYSFAGEPPEGLWINVTNKFMAVRLPARDGWNYGWVRMDVSSNKITIKDFAFEPESDKSIFAGYGMLPLAFNLSASDISNNQNGSDMQLKARCEIVQDFVDEYRMIAVKSEMSPGFNVEQALQLPPERYKVVSPDADTIQQAFDAGSQDSEGDLIVEFLEYKVFVLSIPKDTLNAPAACLSEPSNPVTLKSVVGSISNLFFDPIYNQDLTFDFQIGFAVPEDETGISAYRLMMVDYARWDSFTMDSAAVVQQENYLALYPDGNDKSVVVNSSEISDYSGQPIAAGEYLLFVLTVPDSIGANTGRLHHSPAHSLILSPLAAQNLNIYDNGDDGNSSDIYMSFYQADTNSVSRFMLVEQNAADTFTTAMAALAVPGGYFDLADLPGNYALYLPANLSDYSGNPIVEQTGYHLFALSLPDTIHTNVSSLSLSSNVIALATPHYLKAGQTTGDGITWFDFDPDVEFSAVKETITYHFDLNLDGTDDFYFYATHNSSPMFSEGETGIVPLNGNQIAIKNPDFDWAMPIDSGLMISEHLLWHDAACIFSYYYSDGMGNQYSGGFWQGGIPQFAGLQMISGSDTLYGWLRIQAANQSVVAFDYASYDHETIGMNENSLAVSIYPNPVSNSQVRISVAPELFLNHIQVYDMKSKLIKDVWVDVDFGNAMILNISGMSTGIYLLTCFTDTGMFSRKLVVR